MNVLIMIKVLLMSKRMSRKWEKKMCGRTDSNRCCRGHNAKYWPLYYCRSFVKGWRSSDYLNKRASHIAICVLLSLKILLIVICAACPITCAPTSRSFPLSYGACSLLQLKPTCPSTSFTPQSCQLIKRVLSNSVQYFFTATRNCYAKEDWP